MPYYYSGPPNIQKREHARKLLSEHNFEAALKILAGSAYGAGYDHDYFELMGMALLGCGHYKNAGRFLFLSGQRKSEYEKAIVLFLSCNHDPNNFRQLHSQFPKRVKTMWKISKFPKQVYKELKKLGFPENIQQYFIQRNNSRSKGI